ncbi:MAG TPA: hypothetical protein VGM90_27770 [Kofleriaceae bacterium]|jgi:hypothetical protein
MKRLVLCLGLIGCGGAQHTEDDEQPLTAEQQQCVDQHQRNNALTSMRDADLAKLSVEANQAMLSWVHDLADSQCRNNESAAKSVLHRRTSVSLVMSGTAAPPNLSFDRATSRATGVVEVSELPGLAARPDVVQLTVARK